MMLSRSCSFASPLLVLALLLGTPNALSAQQQPRSPGPGAKAPAVESRAQQPQVRTVAESQDARETRGELRQVLDRYSPALGGVLKLDPSLLNNAEYLAPYPGLAEFVARHPEIARDPAYFFENVDLPGDGAWRASQADPRLQAIDLWRRAMEAISIFTVMLIVVSTLVWLIKMLVDYRRWSRLSKVQAEVHNKVLDRFANNEDLLAYVQTPAGRRFLESAPITLDPAGPAVAAPLRRILWAIEAGFVMLAGGIGMQYVSGRVPPEVSPMMFALGVLGVALGLGFIAAAGASFLISKRLGLLQPAQPLADRAQV